MFPYGAAWGLDSAPAGGDKSGDMTRAPDPDPKEDARRRLFGRLMVILLGVLLAAYILATFWR